LTSEGYLGSPDDEEEADADDADDPLDDEDAVAVVADEPEPDGVVLPEPEPDGVVLLEPEPVGDESPVAGWVVDGVSVAGGAWVAGVVGSVEGGVLGVLGPVDGVLGPVDGVVGPVDGLVGLVVGGLVVADGDGDGVPLPVPLSLPDVGRWLRSGPCTGPSTDPNTRVAWNSRVHRTGVSRTSRPVRGASIIIPLPAYMATW
jgi:hypothetical protein